MSDLPFQGALQQSHARPISGEELEAFGKKAADAWASGNTKNLNEAVVETVKHAGLSPEQVRRVIEFTNTSAYLMEFKKEGSPHRVVEFPGGPADPSAILQDLNDGGGGSVFDPGHFDHYSSPPAETKIASAAAEKDLVDAIFRNDTPMVQHNPLGDVVDLRDKLAAVYENQTSILTGLEGMYLDLSDQLYGHVKQATLGGYSLGQVLQAWAPFIQEPEYIKIAFSHIAPRLVADGVFWSMEDLNESIEKVATGQPLVNQEHPLIQTMGEWCETLNKIASIRDQQKEIKWALNETTGFLANASPEKLASFFDNMIRASGGTDQDKTAAAPSPGLIGKITGLARAAAEPAGEAGGWAAKHLFGAGSPHIETAKNLVGGAVKYAPHAAAAGLAMRGAQHLSALGQTPVGHAMKSVVPGTQEYQQKQQQLLYQYGGFPYPQF